MPVPVETREQTLIVALLLLVVRYGLRKDDGRLGPGMWLQAPDRYTHTHTHTIRTSQDTIQPYGERRRMLWNKFLFLVVVVVSMPPSFLGHGRLPHYTLG